MSRYPEFDFSTIEGRSFAPSDSKVKVEMFAGQPRSGASFLEFLESLPSLLAGNTLRQAAEAIVQAKHLNRAVIVACGGHVVKCGLAPTLITLMECGLISALAVNGAVAVHDVELALFGATSENVEKALQAGTFGMARETGVFYNHALRAGQQAQLGAGEAIGKALLEEKGEWNHLSLLAQAYRLNIPVSVHIAIGTDIVHMHPAADGQALGETSLRDFKILTAAMRDLPHGGVLMNLGSAVILPEVLLKAMAILRNQSADFTDFLGVNIDFAVHYRAHQQLVQRIEAIGGRGLHLTGHHEILVPMLAFAILEYWNQPVRDSVGSAV